MSTESKAAAHQQGCGTCKFWRPLAYLREDAGRCKRFPPGWFTHVTHKGDSPNAQDVFVSQPMAFKTDWCGEYAAADVLFAATMEEKS